MTHLYAGDINFTIVSMMIELFPAFPKMSQAEFRPKTSVFEWSKTEHVLVKAAIMMRVEVLLNTN
jgi:hypothetical protein